MKDKILKQIEIYKSEVVKVSQNRERLLLLIEQHEAKMHSLTGAVSALERLLKEEDEDGRIESGKPAESETSD